MIKFGNGGWRAIIADGFNNLSDSLSSVITLIGFKLSNQQADEEHPYGHGRMEYIAAMLISMVMVVVAVSQTFPADNVETAPSSVPKGSSAGAGSDPAALGDFAALYRL